jgi:hypothetical protein
MSIRRTFFWLSLLMTAATAAAQHSENHAVPENGPANVESRRSSAAALAIPSHGPADSTLAAAFRESAASSRRWTVLVDNDLFAFGDTDRDYTAGVAFTLTGDRARSHWLSPSRLLDRADAATGFAAARSRAAPESESLELGLLLFTPQDLAATEPLPDDRPYANLLYVASSKLALDEPRGTAFQSSLAIGFLGLPLAEQVHRGIHAIIGSTEPRGYDHQISAGGEPTFMYAASRYRLLASGELRGRHPYSVRLGFGGSVGYITEGNVEIAVRTDAPWWASSPASGDYAGHPLIGGAAPENRGRLRVQLEAGAKVRARVYNAFLEGQFRRSDVTFGSSELEPLLVDVWFGATTVLRNGLSVSYSAHRQTEEIERRRGGRAFTWASIAVAQRF